MADAVDVAIIGGGMVGASLAIALAKACPHLSVLVLEAVDIPAPGPELSYQPSYDARSTALSYGTRRIYERLELWDKLQQHITPIERIHVSDRGNFGCVRLQASEYRLDALGYVVENQWLGRVLWAEMKRYSNIEFRCPVRVVEVAEHAQAVGLKLEDTSGSALPGVKAQLAVLADGGRSHLRQQLRVAVDSKQYDQAALIANLSMDQHHQYVAYERFTDAGPMALLPLGERNPADKRMALVWTLPADQAQVLASAPEQEFLAALQQRFGYRLGQFVQVGSRQLYPLILERALEQVRPGLVLVGNAAHILHPVAGQSYNLALREVMGLVSQLAEADRNRLWLGDLAVLREFEMQQSLDQDRTLQFSDKLIQVFSNRQFPWVPARGLGLMTLELMNPLKQSFARYAMGMGGREAVF